jgi:hypothetical protein
MRTRDLAGHCVVRPRWALRRPLRQHSCRPLCMSFHFTVRQLECADAAPSCRHHELPPHELQLLSGRALCCRASSQKLLLKRITAGRRCLSTTSLTAVDVLLSMITASCQPPKRGKAQAPRAAANVSETLIASSELDLLCASSSSSAQQFACLSRFAPFPQPVRCGSRHFFEVHCLTGRRFASQSTPPNTRSSAFTMWKLSLMC